MRTVPCFAKTPRARSDATLEDFVTFHRPITRLLAVILLLVIGFLIIKRGGYRGLPVKTVVVYTSQDQTYAEPIFQNFTKQTGIKVLPVYDSEAVKTVGLVNRL
ncbi:MAG: hypothetical protein ABIQ35_12340, partial [Verrucomicrobiota bacterium]